MAHRRSGFSKKIETVHWTGMAGSVLGLATDTSAARLLNAAQHLPETLLRIRGEWTANFSGVQTPPARMQVTVGIIQVPEGTGTTVLWDPTGDADAPWIWWDTMALTYQEMVTDVIGVQAVMAGRRVVDSKAMRKLRNTELQLVVTNSALTGTSSSDTMFEGRVLTGS